MKGESGEAPRMTPSFQLLGGGTMNCHQESRSRSQGGRDRGCKSHRTSGCKSKGRKESSMKTKNNEEADLTQRERREQEGDRRPPR